MTEVTMRTINDMGSKEFIQRFGGVYKNAEWAAQEAYECRPFASLKSLSTTLSAMVRAAPHDAQRRVLRSYQGLGGLISVASPAPQAGGEAIPAGLDRLSPEEFAQFRSMNKSYEERFDIPFVIDFSGLSKNQVMADLERRLRHEPEVELGVALLEVGKMADRALLDLYVELKP